MKQKIRTIEQKTNCCVEVCQGIVGRLWNERLS